MEGDPREVAEAILARPEKGEARRRGGEERKKKEKKFPEIKKKGWRKYFRDEITRLRDNLA
jgi:hypothetical protein